MQNKKSVENKNKKIMENSGPSSFVEKNFGLCWQVNASWRQTTMQSPTKTLEKEITNKMAVGQS